MSFLIEEPKLSILDFSQEAVKVSYIYFTQYNTLKVKLSNLRLTKLKSGIKNGTQVTSNIS